MPGRGSLGVMSVELRANSKRLKQGLLSAQHSIRRFRRGLTDVGRKLTTTFSLAGAAVGGISVKMASDFQTAMTRIRTEVGITTDTLRQWTPIIREVSTQTATGMTEVADGLRKITSDGLRGKEALDAMRVSAKLAAIGYGDMEQISRVLTSSLNAFSKQGLTAAKVGDLFASTIREGNVRAEQLAPALSKVIGIASSLGASFQDVGTFFATLTRIGTPLSQASTALRGVFRAFIKHSKQAGEALASLSQKNMGVSLTFADLRQQLREKGLLSVLQTLRKVTDNTTAAYAKLFPRMRGLVGILGTISTQANTYNEIARKQANVTGMVDRSLKAVSKTIGFKTKQAFTQLKNASIELGNILAPVFVNIVNQIQKVVDWFSNLSTESKKLGAKIGVMLTVIGPSIWIFGKITGAVEILYGAITILVGWVSKLVAGFVALESSTLVIVAQITGIIAALTGLGVAAKSIYDNWSKIEDFFKYIWINIKSYFISGVKYVLKLVSKAGKMISKLPVAGANQALPAALGIDSWVEGLDKLQKKYKQTKKDLDFKGLGGDLKNDFVGTFKSMFDTIKQKGSGALSWVKDKFGSLKGWFDSLFEGLGAGIPDVPVLKHLPRAALQQKKPIQIPVKLKLASGGTSLQDALGFSIKPTIKQVQVAIAKFRKLRQETVYGGQAWKNYSDKIKELKASIGQGLGEDISRLAQSINSALVSAVKSFGNAIKGLAAGTTSWRDIGATILDILANLAIQAGIIISGLGEAVAAALNPATLFGTLGISATVAGAALIAAGVALKAAVGAISGGGGGGGGGPGGGFSYSNTPGMKEGGIVPAGYPNDTYPAMLTSGERVTPPHKLPSGGGSMDYGRLQMAFERAFNKAHITADGDSLRLVINNAQAFGR